MTVRFVSREDKNVCYFPPVLGNGDMVLYPDKEGTLRYTKKDFGEKSEVPDGCIFRAGRRLMQMHDRLPSEILSFGTFSFDRGAVAQDFTQELREQDGIMQSICQYDDGGVVTTTALVHPDCNLYAVNKRMDTPAGEISFIYTLQGYDDDTDEAITKCEIIPDDCGARVRFVMQGQDRYKGEVMLFLDRPATVEVEGRTVTLRTAVKTGDTVCFYLSLNDDLYDEDPYAVNDAVRKTVAEGGFARIQEETVRHWNAYFEQGFVRTGDTALDSVYSTALYHLKCFTTRWSIPVGLNNCAWHGKFFAFDEYYCFLGLLGANRTELAKHVPAFRARVCLKKAIRRGTLRTAEQARFTWETGEYGEELAPAGAWMDHVFHMAVVALGAFEYYEYTNDLDFLRECYRMIKACAKFYTLHMLYTDSNGKVFVGRCTDLERLGSSVEHPFMTACGIIRTLECLVKAADILDTDREYRDECEKLAERLRDNLPKEDGRYVPYPGCKDASIAVFAGKFPFDVLKADDPCLMPAWRDYLDRESGFGNMYTMGKRTSSWYACWKAEGFARCGMAEEAYASLQQVTESTGAFGEMFEINEPGILLRPWFSTASGVLLSSISDMLVQCDGETLNLLPAWPENRTEVSCKLAVKGGAVLYMRVEGGELKEVTLTMRPGLPSRKFNVLFRGVPYGTVTANETAEE